MSNTYCPMPWVGLSLLPGMVTPCCQWHGAGVDLSGMTKITDQDTKNFFQDVREKMLAGEKVRGCEQCYLAENSGITSRRQELVQMYGRVEKPEVQFLDISFDNICNLKCRGCMSTASHLWYSDEQAIYGKAFYDNKYHELDIDFDLDKLTHVSVSGGEPFLSKKFEKFARKLSSSTLENQMLAVHTNGTVQPSNDVYQCLLKAKETRINISIDGIGKLNEFFRHGSVFSECEENFNFYRKLIQERESTTWINIHTTVSVYNVNLLGEIKDYFDTNYPEFNQSHRVLYRPEQMCIKHLPDDLKDQILPLVEKLGSKYIDVLTELKSSGENYFDHFLNFHDQLNQLRSEKFESMNPLLENYIKDYNRSNVSSKEFFIKMMNDLQ